MSKQERTFIDRALLHAQLVDSTVDDMERETSLIYLQKKDVFYYWSPNDMIWVPDGYSFLMSLFNAKAPRILINKTRVYHDVIFQLKLDKVTLPARFQPNPTRLYFKNAALNLI